LPKSLTEFNLILNSQIFIEHNETIFSVDMKNVPVSVPEMYINALC